MEGREILERCGGEVLDVVVVEVPDVMKEMFFHALLFLNTSKQLKSLVCLQLLQVWKISERVWFNVPDTVFVQVPG